ncbi:MAG: prolipoprotein diacylglyceryl transferase [Clostridia bacterium]|nr:prolipoprotein diacylglyceryl transferase [Clostridia bacterium]
MNKLVIAAAYYGYDKLLYDVFFALGFVAVFFFFLWRGKYFGVSPIRSVLLVLIVYPSVVLWMFVQYWIETGTFGGNNIVRSFVYMPLFAIPASKILKLNWKQACDMLAPATCVVQSVSHWGCIFIGCCHGYPSSWGIFNTQLGRKCFPSQPLEALTAALIIVFILWREKKNNHQVDGLSMPIMLMLFGSTRFFWEFFRDNEKLWLNCSSLAFHALFMSVVGLIMYIIIRKQNEKQKTLNA